MVTLAAPPQTLTFTRTLHAPVAQVYTAFTDKDTLSHWLADHTDLGVGDTGHVLFTWEGGRLAFGAYTAREKDQRVAFTWHEGDTEGQVEAAMTPQGDDTQLTLNLSGLGEEARADWETRLETLGLMLEDGADLRITGRVILGVYPSDFNEKIAAKLGIPVKDGVRVANVIPGYSAESAGIRSDDVIVGLNGQDISEGTPLSLLVRGKRPGETVQVAFYRDGQKQTIPVTLKGYPLPEAVTSFAQLADRLENTYAEMEGRFAAVFDGVPEADAARQPAPKEWSANQVLAHLIMSERWQHNSLGTIMDAPEADGWSANHPARIAAMTTVYPTSADLLDELRRAHAETVALVRSVPDEAGAVKRLLWQMNFQIDGMVKHTQQHFDQIQAALGAAQN
jgi:uncharacterized protein YndB with AHSA1/START domain